MITVYGSEICRTCRNFKAIINSRKLLVNYINITENIQNLREFLAIRDEDPMYDAVKKRGGVGIPLFVNEEGIRTLDINEALSWMGEPPVNDDELVKKSSTACTSCN